MEETSECSIESLDECGELNVPVNVNDAIIAKDHNKELHK